MAALLPVAAAVATALPATLSENEGRGKRGGRTGSSDGECSPQAEAETECRQHNARARWAVVAGRKVYLQHETEDAQCDAEAPGRVERGERVPAGGGSGTSVGLRRTCPDRAFCL